MTEERRKDLQEQAQQIARCIGDEERVQVDDDTFKDEDNYSEADTHTWVRAWLRVDTDEPDDAPDAEMESLKGQPAYEDLQTERRHIWEKLLPSLRLLAMAVEQNVSVPSGDYLAFTRPRDDADFQLDFRSDDYGACIVDIDNWLDISYGAGLIEMSNQSAFGKLLGYIEIRMAGEYSVDPKNLFGHFVLSLRTNRLYYSGSVVHDGQPDQDFCKILELTEST